MRRETNIISHLSAYFGHLIPPKKAFFVNLLGRDNRIEKSTWIVGSWHVTFTHCSIHRLCDLCVCWIMKDHTCTDDAQTKHKKSVCLCFCVLWKAPNIPGCFKTPVSCGITRFQNFWHQQYRILVKQILEMPTHMHERSYLVLALTSKMLLHLHSLTSYLQFLIAALSRLAWKEQPFGDTWRWFSTNFNRCSICLSEQHTAIVGTKATRQVDATTAPLTGNLTNCNNATRTRFEEAKLVAVMVKEKHI